MPALRSASPLVSCATSCRKLRVQSAIRSAVTSVTRTITVAAGVFGPGHLGELTQIVPFELADGVLEQTGTRERRLRLLPSPGGPYFGLGVGVFPRSRGRGGWGGLPAAAGRGR